MIFTSFDLTNVNYCHRHFKCAIPDYCDSFIGAVLVVGFCELCVTRVQFSYHHSTSCCCALVVTMQGLGIVA